MKPRWPAARALAGFTLIEMMVTVVLLSILTVLAFPAMTEWVRNSRVRAGADALQNGLRLAQTEALRRSRQTVFSLTNELDPKTRLTAVANGRNWSVNTVKLMSDESTATATTVIEAGVLIGLTSEVQITGPAAICFNSLGRPVPNTNTGVTDGNCGVPASPTAYDVTTPGATRPLRVQVSLGGQVRMCDPYKALSTSSDGC